MSPGLPIDGICLSGFLCAKKRTADKAKPMTNAPQSASASIAEVVEVIEIRGTHAANAPPQLLIEVPHGATRTEHFTTLAGWLHGDYPADLIDFFHVNTDVGAPELAVRTAERFVDALPNCNAVVLRCLIPRTFIDCNRIIDDTKGGMTPGLHAWVKDPRDKALLLGRYHAYRSLVERMFAKTCAVGGHALMVHSYAPRNIEVPVDDRIVEQLRKAYQKGTIETFPLRPSIDLIHATPEGVSLASPALLAHAQRTFAALPLDVAKNSTYPLHPSTLACSHSLAHPQRTLCLEVRRDLLVAEFTPFAEMRADLAKVDHIAKALALAAISAHGA